MLFLADDAGFPFTERIQSVFLKILHKQEKKKRRWGENLKEEVKYITVGARPAPGLVLTRLFCSVGRKQGSEDSFQGPDPPPVGEEEVLL